jgi:rubrerythrin
MHTIAAEHEALLDNLHKAFNNESSAHLGYLEFAAKADGEGWHGIASLFRAAARAEEIHAANHARVLHTFDAVPAFNPGRIDVGATVQNVRTALAAEIFEVDTMYPAYLEQARALRDVAAVRTFTWALSAEKTHERLFDEALALLEIEDEDAWITMARDFYVCPVCGYTSEYEDDAEICPTCFCARSRFEAVR